MGSNNLGQLGENTTTRRNAPKKIGIATNWKAIDASSLRSLAIKRDGTLYFWGDGIVVAPAKQGNCH